MPTVSVLTTVHNGAEHLPEAVDSILRQSFQDFEYVIVDDGSTDATPSMLASLQDERVRVVSLPRSGRGHALNAGLAACSGPLVAILDADDAAYPDRLSVQEQVLREHPEIAVLGASCEMGVTPTGATVGPVPEPRAIPPRQLIKRTEIAHSTAMMRRDSVEAVGGYDTNRDALFDYDLWIRLAQQGFVMARVDVPLGFHRIHQGQKFERSGLAFERTKLRERRRAVRLFGDRWSDALVPFAGFLFGLIPIRLRARLFRLAGQ